MRFLCFLLFALSALAIAGLVDSAKAIEAVARDEEIAQTAETVQLSAGQGNSNSKLIEAISKPGVVGSLGSVGSSPVFLSSPRPLAVQFVKRETFHAIVDPRDYIRNPGDSLVIEVAVRAAPALRIFVSKEKIATTENSLWSVDVPMGPQTPIVAQLLVPNQDARACQPQEVSCRYSVSIVVPESSPGEILVGAVPLQGAAAVPASVKPLN